MVSGMINQWGLYALRSGQGVIDIGGDPGFLAVELLRHGIPVTVIDPAFSISGKANRATTEALLQYASHGLNFTASSGPFRVIRRPFDAVFVNEPRNGNLLWGASAIVALYPDEATDFLLHFSAARSMRTALIPCNECTQYFPPHEPTYEGFIKQLLAKDRYYSKLLHCKSLLQREHIANTPFCNIILQRTPGVA